MAGVFSRLSSMALLTRNFGRTDAMRSCSARTGQYMPRQRFVVLAASSESRKATPKLPPNAYQLFQKDPTVKDSLGKYTTVAEMSKKLSSLWKSTSEVEKERYAQQAKILREEFEKIHGTVGKKSTSSKPASGYALFVKDNFAAAKKAQPTAPATEIMKTLGSTWKSLSAVEKSKYTK